MAADAFHGVKGVIFAADNHEGLGSVIKPDQVIRVDVVSGASKGPGGHGM
jgi:hypothetical protein